LEGRNDVLWPSSASAAAADRGISCLADHRCGVHLVGGGVARRPYTAWAAGQQVHVVATAPCEDELGACRGFLRGKVRQLPQGNFRCRRRYPLDSADGPREPLG
jgi:hypothetical protein